MIKNISRLIGCIVALCTIAMSSCSTPPAPARSQPQVLFQVAPEYPFEMRRDGIAGEVVVDFIVDEEGRPTDISVKKSSRIEFDKAAVIAVSKWRFKPATIDGKPVRTHLAVPLTFDPRETKPSQSPGPTR